MHFTLLLTVGFIGWFLLISMAAGMFLIITTKIVLQKDDEGKIKLESLARDVHTIFLNQYYESSVMERVSFLVFYGCRFLGLLLFSKFNKE